MRISWRSCYTPYYIAAGFGLFFADMRDFSLLSLMSYLLVLFHSVLFGSRSIYVCMYVSEADQILV
jgi:hypothetical protein